MAGDDPTRENRRPTLGQLLAERLATDGDYWAPGPPERTAEWQAAHDAATAAWKERLQAGPRRLQSRRKPKPVGKPTADDPSRQRGTERA